jgi:hypothetical protein
MSRGVNEVQQSVQEKGVTVLRVFGSENKTMIKYFILNNSKSYINAKKNILVATKKYICVLQRKSVYCNKK